jgi:hypothetical protein
MGLNRRSQEGHGSSLALPERSGTGLNWRSQEGHGSSLALPKRWRCLTCSQSENPISPDHFDCISAPFFRILPGVTQTSPVIGLQNLIANTAAKSL